MPDYTVPPLHGLCWLKTVDDRVVPTGDASLAEIASPEALTAGAYELHWCGTAAAAISFARGVEAVGRNAVSAVLGLDGAEAAVLILRADEEPSLATTLDEAVPLHALDNPATHRAHIRWKDVMASMRTMYRSESQTIKPVRVDGYDEGTLRFRLCYPHWNGHLHGGIEGGDNYLSMVDVDGRDFLRLPMDRWPETVKAGGQFLDDFLALATQAGWTLKDDALLAPVDAAGFAAMAMRLSPVFHAMWTVEWNAEVENKHSATRADPENRRILKALREGGQLAHGAKPVLTRSDGKVVHVPLERLGRMEQASMVRLASDGYLKGRWEAAEDGHVYEAPQANDGVVL